MGFNSIHPLFCSPRRPRIQNRVFAAFITTTASIRNHSGSRLCVLRTFPGNYWSFDPQICKQLVCGFGRQVLRQASISELLRNVTLRDSVVNDAVLDATGRIRHGGFDLIHTSGDGGADQCLGRVFPSQLSSNGVVDHFLLNWGQLVQTGNLSEYGIYTRAKAASDQSLQGVLSCRNGCGSVARNVCTGLAKCINNSVRASHRR